MAVLNNDTVLTHRTRRLRFAGQARRRALLAGTALVSATLAGAALTGAALAPRPAFAVCAPLTPNPDNVSCAAPLDGTLSDAIGGNDTITFTALTAVGVNAGATVSGGADNDSIVLGVGNGIGINAGGAGEVLGDANNDTITLNLTVVGYSGAGTVSGGDNADSIVLSNGSIGRNAGSAGQVLGDAGNDIITLNTSFVGYSGAGTVSGGDNADILSIVGGAVGLNLGGTGQVLGDADADTIVLSASLVGRYGAGTVSGGSENDVITLTNLSHLGYTAAGTGQVLGDDGADTITLRQSYVGFAGAGTVSGGADADFIALSFSAGIANETGSSGQVLGDGDNDTITLNDAFVGFYGDGTVSGGSGNDSIALTNNSRIGEQAGATGQVLGDDGADTITLNDSDVGFSGAATVSGGDEADSITLQNGTIIGFDATGQVLGDAGNDTIVLGNSFVGELGAGTVSGGADDDFIVLRNSSDVGRENGSTGQVLGDAGNDTITLDLTGVGDGGDATVSGGADDDWIVLSGGSSVGGAGSGQVLGDAGADTLSLRQSYVGLSGAGTVSGGSYNDSIVVVDSILGTFAGATGAVLGDAGDDVIVVDPSFVGYEGAGTVSGGDGNDAIAFADSFIGFNGTGQGQVLGDADNDTITLNRSFVGHRGAGTVSGGADNDLIQLNNYSLVGVFVSGSGQVLGDDGEDTITLDSAAVGVLGDGTVSGGADDDLITAVYGFIGFGSPSTGQVLGDAGNDTIALTQSTIGYVCAGTVSGGGDDDSISLTNGIVVGAGGNVLGGSGNDTVVIDDSVIRLAGAVFDGGTETDLLSFTVDGETSAGPGTLVNFEQLNKRGSGTLTLNGDQTFADEINIEAGTLIVGGQLTSATTIVNPGMRLETMGGSFVGNVANRGTFSPGGDAVIETTTITGNLLLGPDGTLNVTADPTSADRVNVGGTATIQGGAVQVLAENGSYAPSTRYTIISADGGRTGEFDLVASNQAFLFPSLEYDANNVFLVLDRTDEALPRGLRCPTAEDRLCLAVLNLSPDGAVQADKALSGEVHGSFGAVLIDQSRYVREAILGRLTQATYSADGRMAPVTGPVSFDTAALKLGPADAPDVNGNSGVTFWTEGFGAWGDFDGGTASSADTEIAGFVSGIDARVSGTWRAGLATGYTWSDIDADALFSSAEVDSYYLAAYAGGMAGPFALRTGGAYAWQDIDTARAVVFPGFFERQTASYDADTGQIFGELAYPMTIGNAAVEPFAGLAYVHFDADAFRERGGLAALRGASTSTDTGYTTLGVRIAQTMQWGNAVVTPRISVAWQHAFDDLTAPTVLALQTGAVGGFTVTGVPIAEDSFLLDTGLDVKAGENTTLGVSYSGQFASGVQDNAVKGRFNWKF